MFKRSQTATEYLVILGVVISIAIITVGTLSDVLHLSSDMDERTTRLSLAAQEIGITDYIISDYSTKVELQNNHDNLIRIDSITINNEECLFFFHSDHIIDSGKQKTISCENIYELNEDSVSWQIEINWTDIGTQSSFSQSDSKLFLVGSIVYEWQSVLDSVGYNDDWGGCFNQSLADGDTANICTCDDLNATRTYLNSGTKSFEYNLTANIDFARCDPSYTSGLGWDPIDYDDRRGFNGNSGLIKNLYINRPLEDNVGLWGDYVSTGGSIGNGNINNLALVAANVTGGSSKIGGLIGGAFSDLINIYVSGVITGSGNNVGLIAGIQNTDVHSLINSKGAGSVYSTGDKVGGLMGDSGLIAGSSFFGIVYSTGENVGGLTGITSVDIRNSFSDANVTGLRATGGLVGHSTGNIFDSYSDGFVTSSDSVDFLTDFAGSEAGGLVGVLNGGLIRNSETSSFVFCQDYFCGGLIGSSSGSLSGANIWVNSSAGNPHFCIGGAGSAEIVGTDPMGCIAN